MKKTTKWQKLLAVMIAAGMMVSALAANTVMAADEADDPTLGGGIITPDSTETVPDEVDDSLGQNPPDDEGTTTDVITEGGEQTGDEKGQTGGGQTGEGGTEDGSNTDSGENQNEDVAKIGDVTYTSLDEAVDEAAEGATIELLEDCELTKGFNKTLTFTGNGTITINKQLTSNGEGWMCFGLGDPSRVLTFNGSGVAVEWNSEVGTAPWLMLSLSGTLNVTNGAKFTMTVDSGSAGNRNAIYMNAGSSINVTNGSTFEIYGNETDGKEGQGLQLDKTGTATVNVKGGSTFLIDGTNRGYVNSPTIYVEDSTFTVQNCTSNASNGGDFTAINSTVTYQNNAGHGLSASNVEIQNSEFTADNNGYYGLYSKGKFLVDATSKVTVTRNSAGGDFAGLKLTSGVTDGRVASGAVVTITDNYCSGLSNNGKVVFEEGVNLTITNNVNDKGSSSHGGGIYNSGASANLTLPSNAVIYNNHAVTDGDDIFNNTTATITFGATGQGWRLDGEPDCTHLIDGWYDDSEGAPWEAHAETAEGNHVEEFTEFGENGLATVTGLKALKAAHGLVPPEEPEEPSDPEPENPPYIPDPDPSEPEEPSEPSDPGEEISDPETPQTSFPSTDPSVPDAVPGEPSGEPSETPAETIPDEETPQTAQPPQTGVKVAGSLLLVACASAVAAATLRKKKK